MVAKKLEELKQVQTQTQQRHTQIMTALQQCEIMLHELRGAIHVLEELSEDNADESEQQG
jgi:chaperonin cofactor prefoldin